MLQPLNYRVRAALLVGVCTLGAAAAAAAADPDGLNTVGPHAVGLDAQSPAPANAGLDLTLPPPATEPDHHPNPPIHPPVDDRQTGPLETVQIRRGEVTPPNTTSPPPWYRGGLVSLGLVLLAIVAVAIGLKRLVTSSHGGGQGVLQVLARTHLSPKQSVAVLQMGGRLAFVGITPERISMLRVVEDREEAAILRGHLRHGCEPSAATVFDKHLCREAEVLAGGSDIDHETSGEAPNLRSRTNQDLEKLLNRLRAHQGGGRHSPSAAGSLKADS